MSVESLWNVYVTFGVSRGAQVKLTGLPDIMYLSSGVTVSPSEKIRTSCIYQHTHILARLVYSVYSGVDKLFGGHQFMMFLLYLLTKE